MNARRGQVNQVVRGDIFYEYQQQIVAFGPFRPEDPLRVEPAEITFRFSDRAVDGGGYDRIVASCNEILQFVAQVAL